MSYYVGLDLHSTNTYVGIMDGEDRRVLKGRFPNQLDVLLNILRPYKEDIVGVVVESTFNWYWLVDGLMENGYRVHLAHPPAFQQYSGLKYTDDDHDAFFLAKLLQLGILPEGYIFPKEARQLRDLMRKRMKLVRQRATHILSFKSLVNRNLGLSTNSNEIKKLKEEDIDGMFGNEHLVLSAKANIGTMNYLKEMIVDLEKAMLRVARLDPIYEHLITVPGIGKVLALTIALETGDISRFDSVGHYASYCRCVGSKRLSNNKTKGQNNRKNGNKYLSWAYVEAANLSKRYCPQAQVFYLRKKFQTNNVVAIKALAHKIARACYYIMRDQVPFDETRIFGKPSLPKKGCVREPKRGLPSKQTAPIGQTGAAAPSFHHT